MLLESGPVLNAIHLIHEQIRFYNKCWGREKNPAPFSQKKVEHTNQNLYNKSTPTQLKGETYVLRK